MCTLHTWYTMGVADSPDLSNSHHCHTVIHSSLPLSVKQCLLWRYLFEESFLWIQQLSPGMLSIDTPAVRAWKVCVSCIKIFCWNILQIVEDPQKSSTIPYIKYVCAVTAVVSNERPLPYRECIHGCVGVYTALCILPLYTVWSFCPWCLRWPEIPPVSCCSWSSWKPWNWSATSWKR